jgi:hypothetical protein
MRPILQASVGLTRSVMIVSPGRRLPPSTSKCRADMGRCSRPLHRLPKAACVCVYHVIVVLAGSLPSASLAGAQRVLEADRSPAEFLNVVFARTKNQGLRREAAFERLHLGVIDARTTGVIPTRQINEYIKLERKLQPEDVRAPLVLFMAARAIQDDDIRRSIENRILKEYSSSGIAESVRGRRGRLAAVGKPFELEFDDAITGKHVAIKYFRGKIVVIDLSATWCSPCVKAIPDDRPAQARAISDPVGGSPCAA